MTETPDLATRTGTNIVEVSSTNDSKITKVCLYSSLAEVTRVFKTNLKGGDNKVVISGLPNVLVNESLRVQGRGRCTIHEVSISEMLRPPPSISPKLTSLAKEKGRLNKALTRCKKCISSVERFQGSVNAENVSADQLQNVGQGVEDISAELDDKLIELEEKLVEIEKEIEEEEKVLGEVEPADDALRKTVSITIVADEDCEIEVVLTYGVSNATWDAAYDIHVKTDKKEKQVTLIYKAAILQNTGEPWEDASLVLETVTPTFGLSIPALTPWVLSVYRPHFSYGAASHGLGGKRKESSAIFAGADQVPAGLPSVMMEMARGGEGAPAPRMTQRTTNVTSKGDISATFAVPGLISIPSDGTSHSVTVTELTLDAVMSWVAVPKENVKAHLTAKIKNDSEYTFLKGVASVYVDGSFISRSDVPSVGSQETFDCPLGVDPSIRITYHPRSKKFNLSGFARRTCSYIYEQRITVVNTKSTTPLSSLKIQDQIPVSEDERIIVNLTNPPLRLPSVNKKGVLQPVQSVVIQSNEKARRLTARWDEMEDDEAPSAGDDAVDLALVGKGGKLNWIFEDMAAQSKAVLVLSWEVVCAYRTDVMGLDG